MPFYFAFCKLVYVCVLCYRQVPEQEHVLEHAEEADEELNAEPYIVAVDIGTTSLRSHIYTKNGSIKASSSKKVSVRLSSFELETIKMPGIFSLKPVYCNCRIYYQVFPVLLKCMIFS